MNAARPRPILGLLIGLAVLGGSACGELQPPHVPPSGVSGPNGGSEETLYYDRAGHPHFL